MMLKFLKLKMNETYFYKYLNSWPLKQNVTELTELSIGQSFSFAHWDKQEMGLIAQRTK